MRGLKLDTLMETPRARENRNFNGILENTKPCLIKHYGI